MNTYERVTATSVSAHLRRLGFNPNNDRNREAVRVSGSLDSVRVTADLDTPTAALRMADDLEQALTEAGYTVDRDGPAMYVTRRL